MGWIDDVDDRELDAMVRNRMGPSYSGQMSIDDMGAELTLGIRNSERGFGFKDQIWDLLKREFRILLCETSSKYTDIRKEASELGRQGQTALIAFLAGALGSAIGVSAAAIAPATALLMLTCARVGREAFCKATSLQFTLDDTTRASGHS